MRKIIILLLTISLTPLVSCKKELTPFEGEIRILTGTSNALEPLYSQYKEEDFEWSSDFSKGFSFWVKSEKEVISDTQFKINLNDGGFNGINYLRYEKIDNEFICMEINTEFYNSYIYNIPCQAPTIVKPNFFNGLEKTFNFENYLIEERGYTENKDNYKLDEFKPFIKNNIHYEYRSFTKEQIELNYIIEVDSKTNILKSFQVLIK